MSLDDPGRSSPRTERMRALLSRTAEEQLTEQRQVFAVLADLRVLVADVDDRLRALESASAALAGQVADHVLARAAETLVPQVTAAVVTELSAGLGAAHAESEQRVAAHVDEAVLALAEALLRRRANPRPAAGAEPPRGAEPAAQREPVEPADGPGGAVPRPAQHEAGLRAGSPAPGSAGTT